MERRHAVTSLLLFGVSIILWLAMTAFEAAFVGVSMTTQRVITFLLLVLPAGIGMALGVLSLTQKEGKQALAFSGIALNTLFALFNFMIILFAG